MKTRLGWRSRKARRSKIESPIGGPFHGGAEGTRTPDPHTASVVRYQLRHSPVKLLDHTTKCGGAAPNRYIDAGQPSSLVSQSVSLIPSRAPSFIAVGVPQPSPPTALASTALAASAPALDAGI